jgi:hypothetical protein
VQGDYCWCSDYVPGTTTSTSDCDNSCPGYPDDTCGGDGTYGYISLTLSPSGTKQASTAASSTLSTAKVSTYILFLFLSLLLLICASLCWLFHFLQCAFQGSLFDFSMLGSFELESRCGDSLFNCHRIHFFDRFSRMSFSLISRFLGFSSVEERGYYVRISS